MPPGAVSKVRPTIPFIGDSGSGGRPGAVPAPGAGDAANNFFLGAGGTFTAVPVPTLQQVYNADPTTIPHILLDGSNPLTIQDPTATTGGTVVVQVLARGDGVAGAAGDGTGQQLQIANSAGVLTPAFEVMAEWSNAGSGSEASEIVSSLAIAGAFVEGLRFRAVGIDTQIVSPFAFILSPNGDLGDGLRITTIANDVYVIPQQSSNEFFLGNTVADPSVDLNRATARAISVVPLGTTITVNSPAEWINFGSVVTMAVPGAPAGTIGGLVSATGTFQFEIDGNGFGAGNLFKNAATFKNATGFAAHFGSQYTFVNTGVYQADGQALSVLFWRNCLFQTTWNTVGGGTLAITLAVNAGGFIQPSVGAGVTFTNMRDWEWGPGTFTGTVTNRSHLYFAATNTPAATIFSGVQSLLAASANHRFIRHTGTAQADFGGLIGLGTGATVDWTIGRLAANVATLGAGDSLRIPATLFMGAAGSVNLSSTTANRLDLATGDTFRIVSGALEFAGTAETISRTAGELLITAANVRTSANLEIDGDLNHDGANVGLRGAAPIAGVAFTVDNPNDLFTLDVAAPTVNNNARVLGALIRVLEGMGVVL